jgi:glycogen debranching enzyme
VIAFSAGLHERAFARPKEYLLVADGAYASSSLAGNTRKYHGLLVRDGRVLLSGLDEYLNGTALTPAAYAGGNDDRGLAALAAVSLSPDPVFVYHAGGAVLKKTLSFDGALSVRYDLVGEGTLKVAPLVACRGVHEVRQSFDDLSASPIPDGVQVGPLTIRSDLSFTPAPTVYRDVLYEVERERGYAHREDLFCPGIFEGEGEDRTFWLTADAGGERSPPRKAGDWLSRAADTFLAGDRVLAGYHWFAEEWGRDTFVSLPGLLLARGDYSRARRIFTRWAGFIRDGLLPNRPPDDYNSSDAALWFVLALARYAAATGDTDFVRSMRPAVAAILGGYGDNPVTHLNRALISVAPRSTWMDTPFTPRAGKPVEVNALWVAALRFAESLGIDGPVTAREAEEAFCRFWNEERGCFFDLIDPPDPAVRPNQVVALALGIPPVGQARKALAVVRSELLTPFGLRTLSPREPGYAGRFTGDAAYHNGTVWPWLLGFYIEALRIYAPGVDTAPLLLPLVAHLADAGLGTVSECFDGDPPHRPGGCISQAWSVAEVLRGSAP